MPAGDMIERFEIAGNEVVCGEDDLRMAPFRQDLVVALLLTLLMLVMGTRELVSALHHALAWLGLSLPPLGGIDAARAVGHACVGLALCLLGTRALFRAGLTTTLQLMPSGDLVTSRLFLAFREIPRRSFPRREIDHVEVVQAGLPLDLVMHLEPGERTETLLSLPPSVGRRKALEQELELLAALLNRRLRRVPLPLVTGSPGSAPAPAATVPLTTRLPGHPPPVHPVATLPTRRGPPLLAAEARRLRRRGPVRASAAARGRGARRSPGRSGLASCSRRWHRSRWRP